MLFPLKSLKYLLFYKIGVFSPREFAFSYLNHVLFFYQRHIIIVMLKL
jgi:hypothetical protein